MPGTENRESTNLSPCLFDADPRENRRGNPLRVLGHAGGREIAACRAQLAELRVYRRPENARGRREAPNSTGRFSPSAMFGSRETSRWAQLLGYRSILDPEKRPYSYNESRGKRGRWVV